MHTCMHTCARIDVHNYVTGFFFLIYLSKGNITTLEECKSIIFVLPLQKAQFNL